MMNPQALSKRLHLWRLTLIVAATLSTGAIAYFGISQTRQTSKPAVETKAAPVMRQIVALGRLQPATEVINVSVGATLSNDRVAKLLVQRGDTVKAGQVIAIMDAKTRRSNALAEAQAQEKVSLANLAKVQAGAKSGEIAAQEAEILRLSEQLKGEIATQQAAIARWEAEVKTAATNNNRFLSLYKEGAVSASERDQKQLALLTAVSQLNETKAKQKQSADTLREQIKQAKATLDKIAEVRPVDVQAARAEVEKARVAVTLARANLAEADISTPKGGRIFNIHAQPGEVVGQKGILDLGQTDQMLVVAEVYQTDISQIRSGQKATITSESFPGSLSGTVSLIGLQVTQQEVTSGQAGENLDRRVIEVRIQLSREDSKKVANLTNLQVQVAIQASALSSNSQ